MKLPVTKNRLLTFGLLALLLILQLQLWVGNGSIGQQRQLKQKIAEQELRIRALEARNQEILLEIKSLGDDVEGSLGLEERARSELGMVEEGEVFYMMVDENKD